MERKVIRQGTNTLMISLPKKWTKQEGIEKGERVHLELDGHVLHISSQEFKKTFLEDSIVLSDSMKDTLIRSIISNYYKKGFDRLEVAVASSRQGKIIRESVNSIMGFEITDEKDNVLVIEQISDTLDQQFERYLRRSFYLVIETFCQVNLGDVEKVEELNVQIKKFTDLCKRAMFKEHDIPSYLVVWNLEKLSNELLYFLRMSPTKAKLVTDYLIGVKEYFEIFNEQYWGKRDFNKMAKIKDALYYDQGYKLLKKYPEMMHLMNSVRIIYNSVNPLIGSAIGNSDFQR